MSTEHQLFDENGAPLRSVVSGEPAPPDASARGGGGWSDVPWRTIVATVGIVVSVWLAGQIIDRVSHVLVLLSVAGFFAVVLARPVAWLSRRTRLRRGGAIAVVVVVALASVAGLVALFVLPLRSDLSNAADLSGTIRRAAAGEGSAGRLAERLNVQRFVRDNEAEWTASAERFERSLPTLARAAVDGAVAIITVIVMAVLFLTQSQQIAGAARRLVPAAYRDWAVHVARNAANAISGYVIGNLLISVCAGVSSFAVLWMLDVPKAAVLALFVAVVDLVPLFGATIGAVAGVIAAFLVSTTAGVVALVFFVVYQQIENNVLQVVIMARTVQLNPLVVLLSVLLGVELFGILGAMLAVPVAGAGLVIIKEVWIHRPRNHSDLIVVTDDGHETMTAARYRLALHLRRIRPRSGSAAEGRADEVDDTGPEM